jgi:hypothetical protein
MAVLAALANQRVEKQVQDEILSQRLSEKYVGQPFLF